MAKDLSLVFECVLNPRLDFSKNAWAFLSDLADKYRDAPDCAMIYDALVKAEDVLLSEYPERADVFEDALYAHVDIQEKFCKRQAGEIKRTACHLQFYEDEFHRELEKIGEIKKGEKIDCRDYWGNKDFLEGQLRSRALSNINDEIEIAYQVKEQLKSIYNNRRAELDKFQDWMRGDEYNQFIKTYDAIKKSIDMAWNQTYQRGKLVNGG